jgi:hypothetical protein
MLVKNLRSGIYGRRSAILDVKRKKGGAPIDHLEGHNAETRIVKDADCCRHKADKRIRQDRAKAAIKSKQS